MWDQAETLSDYVTVTSSWPLCASLLHSMLLTIPGTPPKRREIRRSIPSTGTFHTWHSGVHAMNTVRPSHIIVFFCKPMQEGCTPLHKACMCDHTEMAALLVNKGANLDAKDKVMRINVLFCFTCTCPSWAEACFRSLQLMNMLVTHSIVGSTVSIGMVAVGLAEQLSCVSLDITPLQLLCITMCCCGGCKLRQLHGKLVHYFVALQEVLKNAARTSNW